MSRSSAEIERYAEHELPGRARKVMVSGNTRTTVFMPPAPPYVRFGRGAWIEDNLGHRVLDCNNNYTSLIHGHAYAPVLDVVATTASSGTAFGLPTAAEVDLAELLAQRTDIACWRFSNSGTEAVMTAVRGARAFTNRDKIIRFSGSYHGTWDAVVDAGSPGITSGVAGESLALPQGDSDAFDQAMKRHGDSVAAVVIDLLPNRAGLRPATEEFVQHLRKTTREYGTLLIVDEVITFRLGLAGLVGKYEVQPDLVALGKIIGGGFPVGAVGGTAEVMSMFDPLAPTHIGWGGTFSANPITMNAGLVALRDFDATAIDRLNALGDTFRALLTDQGIAVGGSGSLTQIRESVDANELWWKSYLAGVFLGNNGLVALSTPMTEKEVIDAAGTVATVIRSIQTK